MERNFEINVTVFRYREILLTEKFPQKKITELNNYNFILFTTLSLQDGRM